MSWLGKLIGGTFGFLMGGPLGALLGAALGHQFDQGLETSGRLGRADFETGARPRVQMAFFTATFSVMGHLAKADGRVSQAEIDAARRIMASMDLSEELRQTAIRLFGEGKAADFPLDEVLDQLRQECHRRSTLIRMFIEIQLQAAFADGILQPEEERLLLHLCDRLGFSRLEFGHLKRFFQAQQRFSGAGWGKAAPRRATKSSLDDAYELLGVAKTATDAEIKRAYRRLISQHHPDKLVAKGLPEEMMKIATEKTQKIRKAYELIQQSRQH